jgi:hypothetical protein
MQAAPNSAPAGMLIVWTDVAAEIESDFGLGICCMGARGCCQQQAQCCMVRVAAHRVVVHGVLLSNAI